MIEKVLVCIIAIFLGGVVTPIILNMIIDKTK